MNTEVRKQSLRLAVESILRGEISEVPARLENGVIIRKCSRFGGSSRWGLICTKNGLDFLVAGELNGVITLAVGAPNVGWLDMDYYCLYEQ